MREREEGSREEARGVMRTSAEERDALAHQDNGKTARVTAASAAPTARAEGSCDALPRRQSIGQWLGWTQARKAESAARESAPHGAASPPTPDLKKSRWAPPWWLRYFAAPSKPAAQPADSRLTSPTSLRPAQVPSATPAHNRPCVRAGTTPTPTSAFAAMHAATGTEGHALAGLEAAEEKSGMGLPGQRVVNVDVGTGKGVESGAQTDNTGTGMGKGGPLWVGVGGVRVMPVRGQGVGEQVVEKGGRWGFGGRHQAAQRPVECDVKCFLEEGVPGVCVCVCVCAFGRARACVVRERERVYIPPS